LCGPRWTPRLGKIQGIEKTCRLNPAVSNFLDPTFRGRPTPQSRHSRLRSPDPRDRQKPAARLRACIITCHDANSESVMSMGSSRIFLEFELSPRRARPGCGAGWGSSWGGAAPMWAAPCPGRVYPRTCRRTSSRRVAATRSLDFPAPEPPIAPINQVAMGPVATRHHDPPGANRSSEPEHQAARRCRHLGGRPTLVRRTYRNLGSSASCP
jgi:hypothetical protein